MVPVPPLTPPVIRLEQDRTVLLFVCLPVTCNIDALSYSLYNTATYCDAPSIGQVKLNDQVVWQGNWCNKQTEIPPNRGVSILTFDPRTCAVLATNTYDTCADAAKATELATYIDGLADGTWVIGVTGDEPGANKEAGGAGNLAGAFAALESLGVNVRDVKYRGSFAFIAEKGRSCDTLWAKKVDAVHPGAQVKAKLLHGGESVCAR